MKNIYYKDRQNFDNIVNNIKKEGINKLHILADFDRTLTKNFVDGEKRPSIVSVLRSEGYLGEEYSKKAFELFDTYHPIEIDLNISLEEKKEKMLEWWTKHLELKVESKLHKDDITKVATSGIIQLRDGMKAIFSLLEEKNIPLVIITANGLGVDSISSYLEYEKCKYNNIHILGNKFIFGDDGYVIDFESAIVHVFNKDETCVSQFPKTQQVIQMRKNVILLGDSLGDVGMIEGFEYDNLIKIGFLNDKVDELLEKYLEKYDLVITGDSDMQFFEDLNII